MGFSVGIVGATGITGEVTLRILGERSFPVDDLRLFASRRSVGRKLPFGGREWEVEALEDGNFDGLDVVISAIESSVSKRWSPKIAEAGAVVIDQSSAFRLDPDVPLVMPEINGNAAKTHKGIIAGPNCTTAVAVMATAPLHKAFDVRSVISSSYQSVSGGGRDAVAEFIEHSRKAADQVEALRGHEELNLPEMESFPRELAFNVFPQCESFPDGADTSTEEEKMEPEMRKMLSAPELLVHATAVRVPVVVGHSVSLTLSLGREVSPDEARAALDAFDGVRVVDRPWLKEYPTPQDAAGIDDILVGRVRTNRIVGNGISLFACGDNLRKGNALNAIQTAELVLGVGRLAIRRRR
jgi:aspartate-semialdehyde dehydrogenase